MSELTLQYQNMKILAEVEHTISTLKNVKKLLENMNIDMAE